jgi:lipid II:glycine glycyltransferase (peptidoglycan interpeptide bridge formation enzyme)
LFDAQSLIAKENCSLEKKKLESLKSDSKGLMVERCNLSQVVDKLDTELESKKVFIGKFEETEKAKVNNRIVGLEGEISKLKEDKGSIILAKINLEEQVETLNNTIEKNTKAIFAQEEDVKRFNKLVQSIKKEIVSSVEKREL